MKSSKEWNLHEVKSGEHELPCPPKEPRVIKGLKLTMIPIVTWTVYILCKKMLRAIKTRRSRKVDRLVDETWMNTEQNQWSKTLDQPIAKYVQNTSGPVTTEAETMPSHDVNLRATGTQWVHTRQWNKSGDISDKTIGEIRKAIDDEFDDNVRILMGSKRPIHRRQQNPKNGELSEHPRSGLNPRRY